MKAAPTVFHPTGQVNFYVIDRGDGWRFWYSYFTCIAFSTPDAELTISENAWTVTTGKHLNLINGNKSLRIPYEEFKQKLAAVLSDYEIAEIPG